MQELLQKIEADAAHRLVLPPGCSATQELDRYKAFLKLETHRLQIRHRAGAGGLEVCRARAAILDVILRHLWDTAKAGLSDQAQKEFPSMGLVALGGYGRAELNPHSDIDFMFLHAGQVAAGKPLPHLAKVIDGILYPLWDLRLKVGHSVRTVEECVKVANSDMQSKTSVIEARLLTGDESLFARFQKAVLARCVQGHEDEYIAMRIQDQETRRAKFGNSSCMQEPNLKSGCGGLRDFQNLLWMAFFKYRTRSLTELEARGFIGESERRQLAAAYDFLLRVRTEMHYHLNRPMDVLSKNAQPAVAHNLGYRERSPSKRIENFMGDLYRHSRTIFLLTRMLERRLALLPVERKLSAVSLRRLLGRRKESPAPPMDGFTFGNGEIHAVSNRVFREQPRRLMRVFLYAQQRGVRLHPDLAVLIRNHLSLVNRGFCTDAHIADTFLTMLNQRGNVAPTLRAMHEVDFLGKYIPEFGKLTCLVQHEFYHQYTADEHTLMCLEQLDRIWEAKNPPCAAYAHLFHEVERPHVLYLALLLHDVGKPSSQGNHCDTSSQIAARVGRRLRLDPGATHTLRLLIENHLLMASVSQRRDLDDPAVIRNFAARIQNPEHLGLLTLHTFVDSQATSDKLWNGFKDSLLWTLYTKTLKLMTGGPEFARVSEKQKEVLLHEVQRVLPEPLAQDEIQAHFDSLPPRYFQVHAARDIIEDLVLAHRFMRMQFVEEANPLTPVVNWRNDPDRACTVVKICTWDRPGLFRKITGSFSVVGLNILSAQIFTRADGIVLDTFSVVDAQMGGLGTVPQREQFEEVLNRAFTAEEADFHALIKRRQTGRVIYQAYSGERLPTRVHFENDASEPRTLIEIEAEDRVGLLYAITQAFTELNLDISAAKIFTERGAAIDTFYVRDAHGGSVDSAERRRVIEKKLIQSITRLDAA